MLNIKKDIRDVLRYAGAFAKWLLLALAVGALGGLVGSVFHISVDRATSLRVDSFPWLIYLLPLGGVLITAFYMLFRRFGHIDTNRVIESVQGSGKVPLAMIPLIFVSTVITHLLGGSAGREGAALQLGGSIGYNLGRLVRLSEHDLHIIVMTGMSSVFAALFGTPLTAAIFAIEVTSVGVVHYAAFFPCFIGALTAYEISLAFGISPVAFALSIHDEISAMLLLRVVALSLLCALVGILFCSCITLFENFGERFMKNKYLRALLGGALLILLTTLVGSQDYNGAGVNVIARAIDGEAAPEAFVMKMIFTAVTIAAGFKGGEIVPTFFIGSTFGCVVAPLLGLDPSLAAAIGFVALFCSVVNSPLASVMLSIEVFGEAGLFYFALACSISYMMSGSFGLYKSQKIVYSKLDDEYVGLNVRH